MNISFVRFFTSAALALSLLACESTLTPDLEDPDQTQTTDPKPEPKPEEPKPEVDPDDPYADLSLYDDLKDYVDRSQSPDFKLGAAIDAGAFLRKTDIYNLAVANFDEMTADNAMKYASVVGNDGSMNFTQVRNFLDLAHQAGLTVYGHTLAWHSQQRPEYLKGLIANVAPAALSEGEDEVLVSSDFDSGYDPFISWGNNSSKGVVDGALKLSNPSAVQYWEAQFAFDYPKGFDNGRVYKLSFRIKGSSAGTLRAGLQILDGYKSAGEFPNVSFDTEWKDVEIECTCNAPGSTRLVFSYGSFAGDIYIDDFVFSAQGSSYDGSQQDQQKKEILTAAMDRWIKGMMEASAQKVSAWDAVNEAISGSDLDGDGYYELQSAATGSSDGFYWQDYLGSEDYVRIVIAQARKYYAEYGGTEPLLLFINDYNLESDWDDNKKLKSLIHWIDIWESDGVTKIDGIATQMHISYYENPTTQASKNRHIEKMFRLMADTGRLVKVSELDMGYVDAAGNTLKSSQLTAEQHKAMADHYEFVVRSYLEIVPPAQQYGITHWCPLDTPDQGFWRNGEPVGLWDRSYNRKYAYAGFANGLKGE